MCPARNRGSAYASIRRTFAAIRSGMSLVRDRYGPATRIISADAALTYVGRVCLLDDDGAAHAGGEVTGERAEEWIAARRRRHLDRDFRRLTRTGERRRGQHLILHVGRDEIGRA